MKQLKIRSIIRIGLVCVLVVFSGLAALIWQLSDEKADLLQAAEEANGISRTANRLLAATFSLSAAPSPTNLDQWLLLHAKLVLGVQTLEPMITHGPEINEIRQRTRDIALLYYHLEPPPGLDLGSDPLFARRLNLLSDRMVAEAQQIADLSQTLADHVYSHNEQLSSTLRLSQHLALLVLASLVLFMLYVARNRILKPLELIDNATKQLKLGHMNARIPALGDDELGQTADLLNQLSSSLQERIERLAESNEQVRREAEERRQSEEKLQHTLTALEQTSALLEAAGHMCGIGGWTYIPSKDKLIWSKEIYEILEAPSDFLPTVDKAMALYDPQSRELIERGLQNCLKRGEKLDVIVPINTLKGNQLWVQVYGEPRFEGGISTNPIINIAGSFQDVTRQREQEQALIHAIDLAQEANRAKGEFLANTSHEIRTPLNAIRGLAYILRQTELNTEQQELLERLEGASRTLIDLVTDILDLSKIEAGRMEVDKHPFDLYETFDDLASVLGGMPQNKQVELIVHIDHRIPNHLEGDGHKLRQILLNLGSNAMKFTAEGQVRISATAQHFGSNACTIRFEVFDTGIGMSDQTIAHLFQTFSQADTSISRRFGGTGIGLSLSQKLAKLLGSCILVQSSPGKGSVFHFDMAFDCAVEPSTGQPCTQQTVWVADHDALRLNNLTELALHHDWHVTPFASAQRLARAAEEALTQPIPENPSTLFIEERFLAELQSTPLDLLAQLARSQRIRVMLIGSHAAQQATANCPVPIAATLHRPISSLSMVRAVQPGKTGSNAKPAKGKSKDNMLSGLHILAVDDSRLNLMIVSEILRNHGAVVHKAEDGQQAIEALQRDHDQQIDLCLMDVQMPVMSGLEATRHIRRNMGLEDLPVLALTAGAMLTEHQQALDSGMNAVLTKPLDVDLVLKACLSWGHAYTMQKRSQRVLGKSAFKVLSGTSAPGTTVGG